MKKIFIKEQTTYTTPEVELLTVMTETGFLGSDIDLDDLPTEDGELIFPEQP